MTKKRPSRHKKGITTKLEGEDQKKRLEIAVKCDSVGSLEAVISGLNAISNPVVGIKIIHTGIGAVNKSDLLTAMTGSRLVLGFNVDLLPKIQTLGKEKGVEIRLYDVIYKLTEDLKEVANSLIPRESEEKITGKAKVIALFKASRKGIILGCEVLEGTLALKKDFRVISAMGPVFSGKIESLHIEKDTVNMAKTGQKVGLKITNFKKARLGDLIECFQKGQPKGSVQWQPKGGVSIIS